MRIKPKKKLLKIFGKVFMQPNKKKNKGYLPKKNKKELP